MATCGSCKQEGMSVEHIRGCYAQKYATVVADPPKVEGLAQKFAENFKPMAFMDSLPASCYAIDTPEGVKFYEVRIGKAGTRWDGFRFVDHLVGSPGSWARYPVKGAARKELMAELSVDPKGFALKYSREFTVCAACGSPLSDPESVARGFGPVCVERF